MTTKGSGGPHEPERPQALPPKATTVDLRTLVDQLVKLGLDFAAEALPAILTRAVKEDLGTPVLLEQLLKDELELSMEPNPYAVTEPELLRTLRHSRLGSFLQDHP